MKDQKRIDGFLIKNPANCIDISRDGEKVVIGSMQGDIQFYQSDNFNAAPIIAPGVEDTPVEVIKYSPKGDLIVAVFKTCAKIYKTNDVKSCKDLFTIDWKNEGVYTHLDFS